MVKQSKTKACLVPGYALPPIVLLLLRSQATPASPLPETLHLLLNADPWFPVGGGPTGAAAMGASWDAPSSSAARSDTPPGPNMWPASSSHSGHDPVGSLTHAHSSGVLFFT